MQRRAMPCGGVWYDVVSRGAAARRRAQPTSQPARQTASQPAGRPINHPAGQTANQPVAPQLISSSVCRSFCLVLPTRVHTTHSPATPYTSSSSAAAAASKTASFAPSPLYAPSSRHALLVLATPPKRPVRVPSSECREPSTPREIWPYSSVASDTSSSQTGENGKSSRAIDRVILSCI